MENVFKVIHWKCVKHESQLITQLIKLQFWGLSIAQKSLGTPLFRFSMPKLF